MDRPRSRAGAILPAGLCLLLSIRTGAADPAEPIARTVTLEEAVASADRAPEMSAAQAGGRVAGAGLRAARAFPDPEIGLITNSINAREAFSLLLPLPWPARARRIEAAAANLETAGRSRDEARASVRQALRAAWFMLAAEEDRARAAADPPARAPAKARAGAALSFRFRGPAAGAAALGGRDQRAALLDRGRRDAALAARTAWGRARAARLRFEAIDTELLPAARQTADLTRLAYQEGKLDLFRLLDAERLLSEAPVDRAGAYQAWGVAQAGPLHAPGTDEPAGAGPT